MNVCLQESKLTDCPNSIVCNCLGRGYANSFWFLPVDGSHEGGGIIIACHVPFFEFSDILINTYTITATIRHRRTPVSWSITGVYGPQDDFDKKAFSNGITGSQASGQSCLANLRRFQLDLS
jgi:hypothetical protein